MTNVIPGLSYTDLVYSIPGLIDNLQSLEFSIGEDNKIISKGIQNAAFHLDLPRIRNNMPRLLAALPDNAPITTPEEESDRFADPVLKSEYLQSLEQTSKTILSSHFVNGGYQNIANKFSEELKVIVDKFKAYATNVLNIVSEERKLRRNTEASS